MRILVFRGGALGDFLVTLPALRALRRRWPEAQVTLVGNRTAAELGVLDGSVNEVRDQHEARWAPLFEPAALPVDLQAWLRRFDLILNFWPDPDGQLAHHFAGWNDSFVSGSADVRSRPAARHFLAPLQRLGCSEGDLAPILSLPASDQMNLPPDAIAIHPGSGSPRKTWPLERWHAVVAALESPVLWITGEADEGLAPPFGAANLVRAHQWPLVRLAATLARCRLYLGHDTGISHLAAAAGVMGIVLFGPTDPAVWAPPTPRLRVLRAPTGAIGDISVDDVLAAARQQVK